MVKITKLKELVEEGWINTGICFRDDNAHTILKRENERILYDVEKDKVKIKYIFNNNPIYK